MEPDYILQHLRGTGRLGRIHQELGQLILALPVPRGEGNRFLQQGAGFGSASRPDQDLSQRLMSRRRIWGNPQGFPEFSFSVRQPLLSDADLAESEMRKAA